MTEHRVKLPMYVGAFIASASSRRQAIDSVRKLTLVDAKYAAALVDAYAEQHDTDWSRA